VSVINLLGTCSLSRMSLLVLLKIYSQNVRLSGASNSRTSMVYQADCCKYSLRGGRWHKNVIRRHRVVHRLGRPIGWVGFGWVEIFSVFSGLGWVRFGPLRQKYYICIGLLLAERCNCKFLYSHKMLSVVVCRLSVCDASVL